MKIVVSSYGTRGDIEPPAAVGRELLRRGHEVCMAVPPDLVGFVESAGVPGVAYGLDSQAGIAGQIKYWTNIYRNFWNIRDRGRLRLEMLEEVRQCSAETITALMTLAEGADLLLNGMNFEQPAASVAEYHGIPFVALHSSPIRANGQIVPVLPFLPSLLGHASISVRDRLMWFATKNFENAERRELGLSAAIDPFPQRMAERGSLEIQAYDEVCFPRLVSQWGRRRPFVGTLTMELPTEADGDAMSWIASGAPPICFGFGSMPVESAADTIAMIGAACALLGERALVCAGVSEFREFPQFDHVKVVRAVNYATVFPACRAVVHHGTGATAAGLRAGIPTLVLWKLPDHRLWGAAIERLKVGTARFFSATTRESLVADLRTILAPAYATRARDVATRMTKPAESVSKAADLVERLASSRRVD